MSFETVTGMDRITLNNMEVGNSLIVYLKDVVIEKNVKFNSEAANFIAIRPETGNEVKLLTGGEASYVAKNIAAKLGKLPMPTQHVDKVETHFSLLGHLVKITKTGSYVRKKDQKTITTFEFARDPSKTLAAYVANKAKTTAAPATSGVDTDDLSNVPF